MFGDSRNDRNDRFTAVCLPILTQQRGTFMSTSDPPLLRTIRSANGTIHPVETERPPLQPDVGREMCPNWRSMPISTTWMRQVLHCPLSECHSLFPPAAVEIHVSRRSGLNMGSCNKPKNTLETGRYGLIHTTTMNFMFPQRLCPRAMVPITPPVRLCR